MNFLLEAPTRHPYSFWVPAIDLVALGIVSLIMYNELDSKHKSTSRNLFEHLCFVSLVFFPCLSVFLEVAYGILWLSIVFLLISTAVCFVLFERMAGNRDIKMTIVWGISDIAVCLSLILPFHFGV